MNRTAGKIFSAFGLTQLVMIVAIGIALSLAYDPWRWGTVLDELQAKFPQVDRIEGVSLEQWVAEVSKVGPLILDARSEAEYRVAHIPGAHRVNVAATPEEMLLISTPERRDADLRRPIVVYCSVGFESGEIADRLKRAGFNKVQMLSGYKPSVGTLYAMATIGNAERLHIADETGTLETGKFADLVVLDPEATDVLKSRHALSENIDQILFFKSNIRI